MISYDRYTELLSKRIHRITTASEQRDLDQYETGQPKACPRCRAPMHSYFLPNQITHDIEKCDLKSPDPA